MLKGFLSLKEASERYSKDVSTIQRRIIRREDIKEYKTGRKANKLIVGEDCYFIGGAWIVKEESLERIYNNGK